MKPFSKQVSNSVQQSIVEITERLFKMAVPIHFVNYFTTNNILWTQMIVRFYNIFNLFTFYIEIHNIILH